MFNLNSLNPDSTIPPTTPTDVPDDGSPPGPTVVSPPVVSTDVVPPPTSAGTVSPEHGGVPQQAGAQAQQTSPSQQAAVMNMQQMNMQQFHQQQQQQMQMMQFQAAGGYNPAGSPVGDPTALPSPTHPSIPPGAPPSPGGHSYVAGTYDPLESILGVFPAVRIRGLPFAATLEDVLIFFQGLVVIDVVLDKVKNEGVVLFANPMDLQMALTRDRHNMGRRYIEVFQGKRVEYYNAIMSAQAITARQRGQHPSQHRQGYGGRGGNYGGYRGYKGHHGNNPGGGGGGGVQGDHTGYLRLRGLPFSATPSDILNFFDPHQITPDSVVIVVRPDGRMSGEAYVSFGDKDVAKKAAEEKNRERMGNRYIEIFVANKEEFEGAAGIAAPTGAPVEEGGATGE